MTRRLLSFVARMNILASLLLLGLGALPINTVFEEEMVVITSEDLDRKRSPVFFAVHRMGDTGFSIDFALTEASGKAADFGPFQLCVLNQPLTLADLPGKLAQGNLFRRSQVVREERATFELRKEEIPNSVLVISLVTRSEPGARNVRGYCLPLAEVMKTARLASRRPMISTGRPTAA